MSVSNQELAVVFRECGQVLQYQGESWFKVRSYLQVADMLEARSQPVVALTDTELKALQGVGKAIFSKIREYEQRRSFNLLERVRSVPEGLRALLCQGLPPAAVRALEAEGITSPAALLTAHGQGNDFAAIPARHRTAIRGFLEQYISA